LESTLVHYEDEEYEEVGDYEEDSGCEVGVSDFFGLHVVFSHVL
jgi:hypothetical protein